MVDLRHLPHRVQLLHLLVLPCLLYTSYHDQGHSPLKTVGFVYDREKQEWKAVEGVNVTLGLPIIRASVDHGTDFYHAGKGNGNELSLVNAIKYAVKMTGREA